MFSYLQANFFQKRFVSEVTNSNQLYDKLQMLNSNKIDKNYISKSQKEFQSQLVNILEQSIENNQYSVVNDLLLNTSKNIAEVFKINNIRMNFEKKKDCSKEANLLFELLKHRVNVLSDSFDYNELKSGYNLIYNEFLLKLDYEEFSIITRVLNPSTVHLIINDFFKYFMAFETLSNDYEEDKSLLNEHIESVFLEVLTRLNCKEISTEEDQGVIELSNFKDLVYLNLVMMAIKVNLCMETEINDDIKKRFNTILQSKEFIKSIHPFVYFEICLLDLILQLNNSESNIMNILNLKEMINLHKELKLYLSFSNCNYEKSMIEEYFQKTIANLILLRVFIEQGNLEEENIQLLMKTLEINPDKFKLNEKVVSSMLNLPYVSSLSTKFNKKMLNKIKLLKPALNNKAFDIKCLD